MLNKQLGCPHYHGTFDIVSIKFKCCQRYYACYFCHLEVAGHEAETWKIQDFDAKAVLCGLCNLELSVAEYFSCNNRCMRCGAGFNPGCKNHWHLYFERRELE